MIIIKIKEEDTVVESNASIGNDSSGIYRPIGRDTLERQSIDHRALCLDDDWINQMG